MLIVISWANFRALPLSISGSLISACSTLHARSFILTRARVWIISKLQSCKQDGSVGGDGLTQGDAIQAGSSPWSFLWICLSLSPFASCSSPRNSIASIMAIQVGGGSTLLSQASNISSRRWWGSLWCFFSMLLRSLICKWTPITSHLSATLW